jgi:hypothetical protein
MDAVAVQAEIKAVIDILNDVKESKAVSRLDSAIARLSTLHNRVAAKSASGLFANPGGEPLFRKNE